MTLTPVNDQFARPFIEYVNERGRIHITASAKGGNGVRYFVDTKQDDRYAHLKAEIPDHAWLIEKAANKGRSPSSIAATVEWLTDEELTQAEAAKKYGRSAMSIRNNRDWVQTQLATHVER